VRLLRFAERSPDPGPAFPRVVMARIHGAQRDRQTAERGLWQPFVALGWRFAATAALALAALVTYDLGRGLRSQPNVVTARLTSASDIFAADGTQAPANRDEVLMMVADTGHGNE